MKKVLLAVSMAAFVFACNNAPKQEDGAITAEGTQKECCKKDATAEGKCCKKEGEAKCCKKEGEACAKTCDANKDGKACAKTCDAKKDGKACAKTCDAKKECKADAKVKAEAKPVTEKQTNALGAVKKDAKTATTTANSGVQTATNATAAAVKKER